MFATRSSAIIVINVRTAMIVDTTTILQTPVLGIIKIVPKGVLVVKSKGG